MKSLLPIIIVVLTLTGAVTYSLARKTVSVKKNANLFGIGANELEDNDTPRFRIDTDTAPNPTSAVVTPTVQPVVTVTPTPTPASKEELPEITEQTKGGQKIAAETKTVKTTATVCTPVYGMANTCTEHVVVDTGAADSIFFNLAGVSYIGGLVAFVKAKSLKK